MKLFLLGFGIGVGIGILIAPSSGRITRETIQDGIAKATDSVDNQVHETGSGMQASLPSAAKHPFEPKARTA